MSTDDRRPGGDHGVAAEEGARRVWRAAEREHHRGTPEGRPKSDRETAEAHPVLTDRGLAKGHAPADDWRDKRVSEEGDKDIKKAGITGARHERQGR